MLKKSIRLMIILIITIQMIAINSLAINNEKKEENKINEVQKTGFEDTYLFDTTDSVITTKTGLKRVIPETFGRYEKSYYPSPSNTVEDKEKLANVLEESKEIMSLVEKQIEEGTLKKHIAADGQYGGTVSDEALAVEKQIHVNTNLKGAHSLATYAPAGEIVTITIPQEYLYLAQQGKMKIRVGLNYNADNRPNRMPKLGCAFIPTQEVNKVGNPFGGMIYLEFTTNTPDGISIPVTVSGAIDTPYYDLGVTTKQEWEESKNAPGLYAELRTPYMRIQVPATEVRNIEDPEKALKLWTNVGALSTYAFGAQQRTLPITMTYDYYVFAGAAVATVGAWVCNFPVDWAKNALNYDQLVSSGGWGNFHEFNHHWQGTYNKNGKWGVGETGEVTNNVMTLASYVLYTNIASYRTENGLKDWNKGADPYCNLKQVLQTSKNNTKPITDTFMYATLIHEFGAERFLEVVKSNYSGGTYNGVKLESYNPEETRFDDFAYRCSVIFEKDLSYYFTKVLHFDLTQQTIQKIKKLKYEEYLPIQNLYAEGMVGVQTGRPYYIPNAPYEFDFMKYTAALGNIKKIEVTTPKYGTLMKNTNNTYTYVPKQDLPENILDEFELIITVEEEGIKQTRKLKCEIGILYENTKIEKYAIDKVDTNEAIQISKESTPYQTTYSSIVNYKTDNGYNLTKASGYFKVPEEGEYEFQSYGDDKTKFILETDGQKQAAETIIYTQSIDAAYQLQSSKHIKIYLKENQVCSYTLYTNNRGGTGGGYVGYRKVGDTNWKAIQKAYLTKEDIEKQTNRDRELPEKSSYIRKASKIGETLKIDYTNASVIKTPIEQKNNQAGSKTIIDGDENTYFHSAYTGNRTKFPHEYIIDLGKEQTFNQIDIYTRSSNTNGTIGDYEIYVTNDYEGENTKWNKIASDNTRKSNDKASNTISVSIDQTTARYFYLKALNNKNGNDFTIVSEIELSNKINKNEVIAQNSSYIEYIGNWKRNTQGNYINGATYQTTDGSLTYSYIGNQMAIYAIGNGTIEVKVDKEESKIYQLTGKRYVPSLILYHTNNGKHTVEIKALQGTFQLDALATNGNFIPLTEDNILKGDINLDGNITPTDLLLLKRHLVAGQKNQWILTGIQLYAADLNDDENVTPTDLLLLKKLVMENSNK